MSSQPGRDRPSGGSALAIDRQSPVPLHSQIRAALASKIESGELRPGDRLLQEKEYAAALGVSLAPVRQAILALVAEGRLYRQQGSGTFVTDHKVEESLSILSSFTESLNLTGRPWSMRVVSAGLHRSGQEIRAALDVDGQELILVRRLALLEAQPIALLSAYFSPQRFPRLEKADLSRSLYAVLRSQWGVEMTSARNVIRVAQCTADEAALMSLPRRAAVLEVCGVTHDQHERPVEYSRVLYHPDRFQFQIDSHRKDDAVLRLLNPSA